jgi:pimeloyl-ACP methyl ester carboxylesterase
MRARLALHPDPDAPVVLILHGYAVPAPWWEEFQMQQLLRRGMSAVRLDLPFHLSRRVPREAPGSGFFSTDLVRTQAVVCQAVEDAAAVVGWLREEIGSPVGVFGVSLGGLVGSLLAANVTLQSAMLVIPACDLVDIILELAPPRLRRRLDTADGRGGRWAGAAVEARPVLEATLAPITPRLLTPLTDPSRIAVVAADHDVIVGARAVRQLAAAWGCECWSFGNGHITVITARGLMRRAHARLESDLLGGTAEDPISALAG